MIPSTAVKDLSGNTFSGMSTSTAWNFTTGNAPPALTLLNKANFTDTTTRTGPHTYTLTTNFDPHDDADALVLMLATEAASLSATVSFGTQAMTQAVANAGNNPVGIYYLDNPSTLGQTVSVTITASGNINGMGFTILALNSSANFDIIPTAVVANSSAQTPLSIDINVPDTGGFVVAGYNNNAGTGGANVASPLTVLHNDDFGSLQAAFGYDEDVAAGNQTYGLTTGASTFNDFSAAVAFVGVAAPANTFSSWISTFGLAVADQDLGDDPDGDGSDNGVENFFGTNPGVSSSGLVAVSASGGAFTFTHPKNTTPAGDLTASYSSSKDLTTFLTNGATDGAGTKIDFTTLADTPSPGFTTATVTGTSTSKLFVRLNVPQP